MGYYASGDWYVKFHDADAVTAAANALDERAAARGSVTIPGLVRSNSTGEALSSGSGAATPPARTVEENLEAVADAIGNIVSEFPELESDTEDLSVFGPTYGKVGSWIDEVLDLLAKHAKGAVDWTGEQGEHWRDRLNGDGTIKQFSGEVIYPGDEEN